MPTPFTPGVYVQEVASGARPIQGVGTSTAAFVGSAPDRTAHVGEPVAVAGYMAFQRAFVGESEAPCPLATAVAGFFQNGGSYCYVLNLGAHAGESLSAADLRPLDAIEDISLLAAPGYADGASHKALADNCAEHAGRFAILDAPLAIEPLNRLARAYAGDDRLRPEDEPAGRAALYVPWIVTADALTGERVSQPPSGHIAGLYARTDGLRGVWKAPAGVDANLRGVLGLVRAISPAEQNQLNPDGVNCIRPLAEGIRVWGARTLADAGSEYRYVPVRRLVTMISQSLQRGLRWVVFEPNDEPLWKSIRRDAGAFLHTLWRDGALQGAKPEEAFFVKCDAETTTQDDIDNGRVNCIVGIAPVRPAEFVLLQISQSAGRDGGEN